MSHELEPVVGSWYRQIDVEKGETFRVVGIDEDNDLIEIQNSEGDVEELDSSAWFEMDLEITEEPEDWPAPIDEDEADDEEGDADWREPLEGGRKSREGWEDDDDEDERDDWDDDDDDDRYGSDDS